MKRIDPLEFSNLVIQEFGVLEKQLGFLVVEKHVGCVRYKSSEVTIGVYYDYQHSDELALIIRKEGDEREYSLGEVVRVLNIKTEIQVHFPMIYHRDILIKYLKAYSEILDKHCGIILEGNAFVYKKLDTQRDRELEASEIEQNLACARREAVVVWRTKEYAKYLEIMEPLLDHLKKSELLKVNYAKKKLLS